MKRALKIAFLATSWAFWTPQQVFSAEQEGVIASFSGLNNSDAPVSLGDNQAQDLLNVEIGNGGKSVRKRKGFGLNFNTTITTSPIHGVYSFYDENGSFVVLAFNDRYLTSSIDGATPTVLFSTATSGATWQCADSLGYAYCASSARDPIIKTDGQTYSQIVSSGAMSSTGTIVAVTTQRLVVAGFNTDLSKIAFSRANDFSYWMTGALATDPYYDTISAAGSRITHLTYACGNLMWFKDSSIGAFIDPDDQFNAQNVTISQTIGTLDNSSVYYNGVLYFRAQDGNFYSYDCASLTNLTRDLQETISASSQRRANSWEQSSQSDFQSGVSSPSYALSMTNVPGSIVISSFQSVENSSTQWNSGSVTDLNVYPSSMTLGTNTSGNGVNAGFQTGTTEGWTGDINVLSSDVEMGCTQTGHSSTYFGRLTYESNPTAYLKILDENLNVLYTHAINVISGDCSWHENTVTASEHKGKRVYFSFWNYSGAHLFRTSSSYIFSGTIKFWNAFQATSGGSQWLSIDDVSMGSSTITSGIFVSQVYDTGFTSTTYNFAVNYTVNDSTPSFFIMTSTASSVIDAGDVQEGTGTFNGERFYKVGFAMNTTSPGDALTTINSITVIARSSGSYYSAVHNASSLTSWDTFSASKQDNGGTLTFYTRASTNSFTQTSATPTWVSQPVDGTIAASTGTYFQSKIDFNITMSTQNPTVSDFVFNWYEGTATDKVYGIYFDDALWWAVQKGTGATSNNAILRYELYNNCWTLFDIPSNGFYVKDNSLYFGSSVYGKVYKYGDSDSDDGSAIDSYWKSKDFVGKGPFTDLELRKIAVASKMVSDSTMTVTYSIDASSAVSYTVPLTRSTNGVIKNNRILPTGTNGTSFNIQVGNNAADQYWELYGIGYAFEPKPWRPGQ